MNHAANFWDTQPKTVDIANVLWWMSAESKTTRRTIAEALLAWPDADDYTREQAQAVLDAETPEQRAELIDRLIRHHDPHVLRAQRDALLELCRALDDIAANEGLGCPDLEARCAELGLDTRCWWRREREEGGQ